MDGLTLWGFLNSTFLVTLVTFLVGTFAITLYIKQKAENKRDAAKLILQEVRYSEERIRTFKSLGQYSLDDKLLPTNSWHRNIHLFVGDLKETEIDLVSRFYSNSSYLDHVVSKVSDKKNEFLVPVQNSLTPLLPPNVNPSEKPQQIQEFDLYSHRILTDVSNKIEFIYNTPAVDKLRHISERRKWLIF